MNLLSVQKKKQDMKINRFKERFECVYFSKQNIIIIFYLYNNEQKLAQQKNPFYT